MLNTILNILFPEKCPVCGIPAQDHSTAPICTGCWSTVTAYGGPSCQRCGRPLVSDVSSMCGDCIEDPPAFVSARGFGLYEGVLRKSIYLMKYHRIKRLAGPLSVLLAGVGIPRIDDVVPVPLYEKRLRQREFNQSALLAKNIAKNTGARLLINCLVKTRDTLPQVGLGSRERRKNIRRAFSIRQPEAIKGRDILLIDDVVTTGATIRECSATLKKAGAENVYVIALAHGMMD